ncbi:MAG: hypothetical protein IJF31_02070, partial [Clostridia bacterium]|nr:hypothetical protein [Clostridia bacterium]
QPMVDLLRSGENVMPVAADDIHSISDAFGGWVMVKAQDLGYGTVIKALEQGDFYASTGPAINELYVEDGVVHISTSEAVTIAMISNYRYHRKRRAKEDQLLTEASFDLNAFIKQNEEYEYARWAPWVRFEVRDARGDLAWTRAYFLDELKGKEEQ